MAEKPPPLPPTGGPPPPAAAAAPAKPPLQKPPGYRDLTAARPPGPPRPPPRKHPLPPSFRPGNLNSNPKHHHPAAQRRRRHRHRRPTCGRLCCCLLVVVLILLFALALVGALSYLWFQPKLPSFHLESIQTPLFRIAVKPDGSFLDATTAVRIQVSNPNGKIGFSYGDSEALVTVADDGDGDGGGDDVAVGSGTYPAFDQEKKNSTVMRFEARVKGVVVDDGLGSRLKARTRSRTLRFGVEVRTRLGVRFGGKKSEMVPVRVICGEVSLKQLEGGALPKCTINMLRWINIH